MKEGVLRGGDLALPSFEAEPREGDLTRAAAANGDDEDAKASNPEDHFAGVGAGVGAKAEGVPCPKIEED